MKKITFLPIVLFLLTACEQSPQLLKPVPPADLVQTCQELDAPVSPQIWDFLDYTVDIIQKYNDCAARHAALAKFAKGK